MVPGNTFCASVNPELHFEVRRSQILRERIRNWGFHSISQACDVGYVHLSIKILSYTMVCEQRYKMHEASLFKTPTSVAINTLQLRGEYMLRGQENT